MFNPFKKPPPQERPQEPKVSTKPLPFPTPDQSREEMIDKANALTFQKPPLAAGRVAVTDSALGVSGQYAETITTQHLEYFSVHGFIGYQACAMLAQHWLIDNACTIPVDDAIRKGWEITRNDGGELTPEEKQAFEDIDNRINVSSKLHNFAKFGRVYGVRIAVFLVESDDPDYYKLPFNIDGIKPGSYKGILMTDPYYCLPVLESDATDPNSPGFYEPTFWMIGGIKYHKTHCVPFIHSEVAQILKPSYIYGGASLTQQIYESVYNAEITASEIPGLIQTMRQEVMHMDLQAALMDEFEFNKRMQSIQQVKNNFGVRLLGESETLEYFQTTLTNLDELCAGRYRIVASVAQIPVPKLMKTDLTGGLVKGGGEEAIYHETLESLQTKLKPFLDRHYELVSKSVFGADFNITVKFNKLDAMTAIEAMQAEKIKTEIDESNVAMGAIGGEDVRQRLLADKQSLYSTILKTDTDSDMDGIDD